MAHNPRIIPYGELHLDPAALVLHYNQEVFEGLKVYRLKNSGGVALFRPEQNIARMNHSARRMLMPEIDPDLFMQALKALVRLDSDWIPRSEGTSLYLRPVMIATEPAVGVRTSREYLFYIIAGPVGAYYAEKGYNQVFWLDAKENRYVEEVGTSNIFFLINDELITPPLEGTILPGITRDSVIQVARQWDIFVSERPIAIDEVLKGCTNGTVQEIFAAGTAAVISPIGTLGYKGEDFQVAGGGVGTLSKKRYDEITGIQYGSQDDPFGWRVVVC